MTYQRLNIVGGWLTFAIATAVYLSTIEPTASFWDCGEFIATAYKLEVGHPPGAPLFMLINRFFTMFAPVEQVAVFANAVSALCSSFTILFLFWTITHLAYKLAVTRWNKAEAPTTEPSQAAQWAIVLSGFIGGMAYTFSDSFWFSAVEGEVYAMSSLFTAIVFWAILKWETVAHDHTHLRWLILIAYVMGLSIGVHLLNLLAIPAICFVYYFRKFKPTRNGIIATALISVGILGIIQSGIIPGLIKYAGKFELLFVNSFNLPFNTGILIYSLLIIGGVGAGLYYTEKNQKVVANTALWAFAFIILGYSTFATIVIRSSANPPMDENNPENVFTLLAYLNREQYGDRPLLYGQYWNAPLDQNQRTLDGDPVYMKAWLVKNPKSGETRSFNSEFLAQEYQTKTGAGEIEQEYIISDDRKNSVYNYDDRFKTIFPRMYSPQANHVEAYKQWSDYKGKPVRAVANDGSPTTINVPTFGENLRFFVNYQLNWMYWRYFMWNFAGRQNDIQGHGSLLEGNWLSGVNFIDETKLGSQEGLPDSFTSNFGYNRFYMLPFLLGLIGLVYQFLKRKDDLTVVALLFFFTGIAIVIYLNQYPYQPRERDYAYAGSFYAYAIWIGLGLFALYDAARSLTAKGLQKIAVYTVGLGVLVYAMESISANGHTVSYSLMYMGVLATAAFALMWALGSKMKRDAVLVGVALLLTLPAPVLMAADGWNDHNRSNRYTAVAFARNYLNTCEENAILFTNGDNDTFPLWYAQEVEGTRTDIRVVNLSLLNTDWYIDQMKRKAYESDPVPFSLEEYQYRQGTRDVVLLDDSRNQRGQYVSVDAVMNFVGNDKNKVEIGPGEKLPYIPTKRFAVPVDREKVLRNGTVALADSAQIVDNIEWSINRNYILKNNLMVLDLLATNDWERPIYFAVTTGPESYIGLDEHFSLEGLAYRLVPIKTPKNNNPNALGRVNTERMYEVMMNQFEWGGMESDEQIYMDENNLRMTTNLRLQMSSLADALIGEGKEDKARDILNLAIEKMPEHNVPYDRMMLPVIENLYRVDEFEKANNLSLRLFDIHEAQLLYLLSLEDEFFVQVQNDVQINYMVLDRLVNVVNTRYQQEEIGPGLKDRFDSLEEALMSRMETGNSGGQPIKR